MPGRDRRHHQGAYRTRAKRVREVAYADPATRCWRCGLTLAQLPTGTTWHAGHLVDGDIYSPLAPECSRCNQSAGARMTNARRGERWRHHTTRIVLVAGPPGAGKSTYVAEHAAADDLVVDYDRLAEALGSSRSHGHDPALHASTTAARNALLEGLRAGRFEAHRAWIVSANPKAEALMPYHEVVVVDPGRDEVVRRARAAGRPDEWVALIDRWYADRSGPAPTVRTSRRWY